MKQFGVKLWLDCLTLEKLWLANELADLIKIEEEALEIANLQPWGGTPAIIASDGLFSFGADLGYVVCTFLICRCEKILILN